LEFLGLAGYARYAGRDKPAPTGQAGSTVFTDFK